ncbi:hypothetical protein FB566_0338 [Stackebrandtia endophytica]|uniref:Uncharacterized protein n=1 Tax=Stackebrandtia endophytica TaxID=1496996 RepID=A0A543AQL2_9ACTN|nr:hypothetical protein [Stackebrandtia endophytica]TQL74849.1 hypothetical protein FB566_0338 [Stackebrandtia endophytica]
MTGRLVGTWSSEASGLYYSSFEDETLTFCSDGGGEYEFARPGHRSRRAFRWRSLAPDRIELTWTDTVESVELTVGIADEDTPLAGPVLMLRVSPAVEFAEEFGRLPSG